MSLWYFGNTVTYREIGEIFEYTKWAAFSRVQDIVKLNEKLNPISLNGLQRMKE